MSDSFWLSGTQWARIEPLLPTDIRGKVWVPLAQQASWQAIFDWRVWVSPSRILQYDETQTLLKSQPPIWAIGVDGEQRQAKRTCLCKCECIIKKAASTTNEKLHARSTQKARIGLRPPLRKNKGLDPDPRLTEAEFMHCGK